MTDKKITTRQAHARLQQVEHFVSGLMRGPNLDASMVVAIRKSGPSAELLARMNLSNAAIQAPNLFKDPLAKDLHITGKVGGLAKRRRAAVAEWGFGAGHHQRTNLMYPASRPSRPRGPDGGRSFHMREEIMHTVKQGARSIKQARQDYTLDASKVPIIEAMLGGSHLERGLYLFRDSVSVDHNGYRFAVTSLGENNDTVIDGWQHIESTEIRRIGEPIERHLTIDLSKSVDLDFWQEIKKQPGAPDSLIDFLDSGDDIVRFTGKESKAVECFLRKNGWHDQKKSRQRADITFNRGRQVITQRRLVFELPNGLPLAAIERIIRGLAKEFVDRNLPFVLVVHKPDETNDDRNWHVHLDYHHRPMRRFDPAEYQLDPVSPPKKITDPDNKEINKGEKAYAKYCLALKALANPDPSWTGKWDSEIEYEYRTPSGRKKKAFPFIQDTHPVFREKGKWLKTLRSKYADIINAELLRENLPDRFDPRSFQDRGIEKIPDAHLNTSRTRCERLGRPTLEGAMNEQCQWNYEVSELLKRYPGGDQPDGEPAAVAGFVSGKEKLIFKRLRSRSEYVLRFASQEEDWDNQRNPTPSSVRRNKRRDYRPERLAREAREMLDRIDDIWPHITQGLNDLAARISSIAPQDPAREAATSNTAKPSDAASQGHIQNGNPTEPADVVPPSAPSNKAISAPPLVEKVAPPSKPAQPFRVNFEKLQESRVAFTISQVYEQDKKVLIASVAARDAAAIGLPRRIIARLPQERADLMSLLDERANIDAALPKTERPASKPGGSEKARLSEASPSAVSPRVTDIAEASPKVADQGRALEGQPQKHSFPNTTKQQRDTSTPRRPPIEKLAKQPAAPFVFDAKFPDRKSSGKASLASSSLAHNRAKPGGAKLSSTPSGNPRMRQTQTPSAQASAPKPKPSKSIVSQNSTALTSADRNQMETKPFYLIKQPAGSFVICSTKAPSSLVSAASDTRYANEFEEWLRRQQSEQQEIAKLFARSRYSDRSETDRAVASGKADPRLTDLWQRWENTLLLNNAVSLGLTMRREVEREEAKAEERKRELQRQAALAQQLGHGI
ncbi:MobA/MobL family protein [Citromicrobium bathyomarinum]